LRKTPQDVERFELNRSLPGSLPATKNHQGGLGDSKDGSDVETVSVPDSESGQLLVPHIQLEMPWLSKQGNAERVLVKNTFGTASASHGDQRFPQYFTAAMCKCTIITLLDDSNMKAFQTPLTKVLSLSFDRRSLNST